MSPADSFELVRAAFEQAGIRYAVGGSWASTTFGEPRFTNDVDIVADFTATNLTEFLRNLPDAFYADAEEAQQALRAGRSFNVIHIPTVMKFDFFPANAFPLGVQELDRAISLSGTSLSERPVRFVTPEDIVLAKLYWFKMGGGISEVQWRDIKGVVRSTASTLDRQYLEQGAVLLGVSDVLDAALTDTESRP